MINFNEPFLTKRGDNHCKPSFSFSEAPHSELYTFVKYVVHRLRKAFGDDALILAPILRIDVFQNQEGKFVVNEIESLEADIYAAGFGSGQKDSDNCTFLFNYWTNKIKHYLKILNNDA